MPVDLVNLQEKLGVSQEMLAHLERAVGVGLIHEGLDPAAVELSIALVDDEQIRTLNKRYRGTDAPTNVLSFSMGSGDIRVPGEPLLLGDIVISLETALAEVPEDGETLSHLTFLVVHGLLHLLGCDHESDEDAEQMEEREKGIIAEIVSSCGGGACM